MAAFKTGAEQLLQAALNEGIEVCFANPGTSEMHFVSALDTVPGMRGVLGLHETVCSGAADGYGRMARKPALTLLHLGPGLANSLANLHNARRAGTPVVNLVGDMATWHKEADPLLNMDIAALAATVSTSVHTCQRGESLAAAMSAAAAEARQASAVGGSRVATLVVPHDMSWERTDSGSSSSSGGGSGGQQVAAGKEKRAVGEIIQEGSPEASFLRDCAAALKACPRGKAALLIGGRATLAQGEALANAGRIAAATGSALYCENAFARMDRGAGLPDIQRLPYFPQDAAATLAKYELLALVDVRRPVANFGYEGGPSQLITHKASDDDGLVSNISFNALRRSLRWQEDVVWELDDSQVDIPAALRMLCAEVGGQGVTPGVNCGGRFCSTRRPLLPTGRLNAGSLCQVIAALQPPNCILVDESLTSGNGYWEASKGCPPFSHLTLTGGAIGCGPPLALGAAIACPDRTVINFQADGSGLYSVQALWSQARERAHVVTIVCANRSYSILKVELAKQKITPSNGKATRALTEIGNPTIDWVSLAQGFGVPGFRATTCEELAQQVGDALGRQGPTLIEAVL
ncbi:hypothetical protein N2152v2_010326 [Parachlorella kessleri]